MFGLTGCSASGDDPPPTGNGGSHAGGNGSGGAPNNQNGGSSNGGTGTGGSGFGGSSNGGTPAHGGSANGGSANGGKGGGPPGNGGSANGGSSNGGMGAGGKAGPGSGGSGTGGKAGPGTGGALFGMGGALTGTGGAMTGTGGAVTGTGGGSSTVSCTAAAQSGGSAHCSSNQSGTANGYTWTIWSSGSGGCLTTYGKDAAYKATWNNSGDFLARVGIQWDETKTYDQYGTIEATYQYTKTGSAGGYSFIGIYGWSNNPLVEYYIVEDWFGSGPPTGGGTQKGTLDIDGGTYKIYTHTQNNQPSIHGNATFPQFFSVRQTARQCGHISLSEHFKKWGTLGMTLGKMYEAKILVEAGGGSGSIDFAQATLTAK